MHKREQLDGEIIRMFLSTDLPSKLARNSHLQKFTFACNNNIIGYVPPGYYII